MKYKVESPGWVKEGKQLLGESVELTEDEFKQATTDGVNLTPVLPNSTAENKTNAKGKETTAAA